MISRPRVKIVATAFLLLAMFCFAMIAGGFLPWFLAYVLATLTAYTILTRTLVLYGIQVRRSFSSTSLHAGDSLNVKVEITRKNLWPIFFLRAQDSLPESWRFQVSDSSFTRLSPWSKNIEHNYKISNVPRGVYAIENVVISSGDLFGFAEARRVFQFYDRVVVYPRIVTVSPSFGKRPANVDGNRASSRVSSDGASVIGVRNYVPGDRINQIHWSMTAKTGNLQTKEFELHVKSEFLFLPDLSEQSYQYSSRARFELAMTITASLMKHISDSRKVFGAAFHGSRVVTIPPSAQKTTLLQCLELLSTSTPSGTTRFEASLGRLGFEARPGTTLVVVSPNLTKDMAITAMSLRRRISIEWFVPITERMTEAESLGLKLMKSAGIEVHLIEGEEHLAFMN